MRDDLGAVPIIAIFYTVDLSLRCWALAALTVGVLGGPASWPKVYGVAPLGSMRSTLSLFIGLLVFAGKPLAQDDTKNGVSVGSLLSAGAGVLMLRLAARWCPSRSRRKPK